MITENTKESTKDMHVDKENRVICHVETMG